MRASFASFALFAWSMVAIAQTNEAVLLWPNGAPGALGNEDKDKPTLTPYLPAQEKATGAAIVICHGGGYDGLTGHEGKDYALWLNELQVPKETPPCLVWHTFEDAVVPVENSLQFATALRQAGVPFDLHVYERGPHGMGLGSRQPITDPTKRHPWTRDCEFWLKARGFAR